ncbi:F-box and wd40 domain protein, partial [Reticulomyxa filosa]
IFLKIKKKLMSKFNQYIHWTGFVYSIDYSTFDDCQLICSGSYDQKVRVWDVDINKQIQSFNEHSSFVYCVKFLSYYYHNHRQNVICSSLEDKIIRFWDFKHNKELQIFNGHTRGIYCIEFSQFNGDRYLCSGSFDKAIRLWDIETSKSLYIFNGHENTVCNNNNEMNIQFVLDHMIKPFEYEILKQQNNSMCSMDIQGNICNSNVICSGSFDNTIRFWDIRSNKNKLYMIKGDRKDFGIFFS